MNGLIKIAAAGAGSVNFDYDVCIKIDGTWQVLEHYASGSVSFTADGDYLVLDDQPEYENTGNNSVEITHTCVYGVQSEGDGIAGLNSDEAGQANSLVFPIRATPKTVKPSEATKFTIKTKL